jgi:hypothetical protein
VVVGSTLSSARRMLGRFDVDAAHVVTELGQADRQIAAAAADGQDPHERAVGEVTLQMSYLVWAQTLLDFTTRSSYRVWLKLVMFPWSAGRFPANIPASLAKMFMVIRTFG